MPFILLIAAVATISIQLVIILYTQRSTLLEI
jgi:hypothetical protein